MRDNPATLRGSILTIGRERIAEALPVLRTLVANEKLVPGTRAEAALVLGIVGTRDDLALLRHIAESKAASEPFESFEVVLKGQEELEALSRRQFQRGGAIVTPDEWAAARKLADIRNCDRSIADCAWAAAVWLGEGKPQDMGFLWPHTVYAKPVTADWLYQINIHGFESDVLRAAAVKKAKKWLAELKKE